MANKRKALGWGAAALAPAAMLAALATSDPAKLEASVDDVNPGASVERDLCLTVALPGGASECGDLRLAHALPAVRTLNQARAPVLLYNSEHASPHPTVAANVRLPSGTLGLRRVVATLKVEGTPRARSVWNGGDWPGGEVARIAIAYDAAGDRTRAYRYTLEVTATYVTGTTADTVRGQLAVVNRRESRFGAGWWMAGVEELVLDAGGGPVLWVGGDGSTRRYTAARGDSVWGAPSLDRPDTLKRVGFRWVRILPGRGRVEFDQLGRHVRTVNRLGHAAEFRYDVEGKLNSIRQTVLVPRDDTTNAPVTTQPGRSYGLHYGADGFLDRVEAPGVHSARVTTVNRTGARVDSITDPDGSTVRFGYADSSSPRVTSRTDRRKYRTDFRYDAAFRVAEAKLWMDTLAVGKSVTTRLRAGQSLGLAGPAGGGALDTARAYARMDGPRMDVEDTVAVWLDRWGAPRRIVNAVGHETRITRGDARFPALATRMRAPHGLEQSSVYGDRGNVLSITVHSPLGDGCVPSATRGCDAITRYAYDDPRWPDFVTRTEMPEGEVTEIGYDDRGNRAWQQIGQPGTLSSSEPYQPAREDSTRVTFGYDDRGLLTADTTVFGSELDCPVRLSRMEPVGDCRPVSTYAVNRYEYDGVGNLNATVTAQGSRTTFVNDALGRTYRVETPTGGGSAARQVSTTTFYPNSELAEYVRTIGPAMNGVGQQVVAVRNVYDAGGNLVRLDRWSEPDTAGVDTITTQWEYDAAGRKVAEIAPDGAVDRTHYDPAGNPDTVWTRRGHRITMRYDELNRLTHRFVPEVRYARRMQGITAPTGGLPTNNRPPYPQYPSEPTVPEERAGLGEMTLDPSTGERVIAADSTVFGYDESGAMVQADNRDAKVRRTYFPNGLLRGETQKLRTVTGDDTTRHVYTLGYTYDRNGRRTGLKHPRQIAPRAAGIRRDLTSYEYDPRTGALAGVLDPLGNSFRLTYTTQGQLRTRELPGGVKDWYRYRSDGALIRHLTHNTLGEPVRNEAREYDLRGKVLHTTNTYGLRDTSTNRYSGLGHVVSTQAAYHGTITGTGNDIRYENETHAVHDALANVTHLRTSERSVSGPQQFKARDVSVVKSLYARGTGRLVLRVSDYQRDTTLYDAAGNMVFGSQRYGGGTDTGTRDRAMFYDAEGRLRASDTRSVSESSARAPDYYATFEEYRYDALGRRVWVRLRRDCNGVDKPEICSLSAVRRVVWDGDDEFYEIQMPGHNADTAATMENDTLPADSLPRYDRYFDPNLFFGRVSYTHAGATDQPVGVVRMGYADRPHLRSYQPWDDFVILPHWNARGQPDWGTFVDGSERWCRTLSDGERCVAVDWPAGFFPYKPALRTTEHWHGSVLRDKQEESELVYRRNRYYDPASGRFTQEDPIGLAGGLNLYGFAAGDPVSYSDPYGLCPKKAEEGSVCLDFFIGAATALAFKGDNRGFDPNASADQSRVQIVVNDGMLVSATLSDTHLRDELGGGTLRALPWTPDGPNRVSTQRSRNGTFTVNVDLTVSVPGASALFPAINSSVTFRPDGNGGYTTSGNRDAMPSLGIYQRVNGEWQQLPGGRRPEKGGIYLMPFMTNDVW